jgi:hypothetical protein
MPVAHHLLQAFAPGPSTDIRGHGFYERTLRSDGHPAGVSYGGKGDAAGTVLLNLGGGWWGAQADPAARVREVYERGGHVARFDLAADYAAPEGAVACLADAVRRREWRTRVRTALCSEDLMSGKRTVYLGSKGSDRRMRVYDLRGPVRVELQARNDYAAQLLESVAAHGAVTAHRAAVRSVVDFPTVGWWGEALRVA